MNVKIVKDCPGGNYSMIDVEIGGVDWYYIEQRLLHKIDVIIPSLPRYY